MGLPQSAMYPSKNNSPQTTLAAGIQANDTSMTLVDATVLASAPGIAVIGNSTNAEVVIYAEINGNVVSGLQRGAGGTTKSVWPADTVVARNFTALDFDIFVSNILDLYNIKADLSILGALASLDTVALASQVTGILPVANGGTGATTAEGIRTMLSLGTLALKSIVALATDVTGTLPVANGGTGSATAADARTALGLGALAEQDSLDYTSAYLTNKPTLGGIQVRPNYTISDTDLTDGVSTLESGKLYFYYEV